MKNFAICAVLSAVLFLSACGDWEYEPGSYQAFAYNLRGTWVSNDPSIYDGQLIIDYNTITISGYSASQTPWWGGDDERRPFKNFTKGFALKAYSEEEVTGTRNSEGTFYIEDKGRLQDGIPYIRYTVGTYPNDQEFLLFTFGGREEILKKMPPTQES